MKRILNIPILCAVLIATVAVLAGCVKESLDNGQVGAGDKVEIAFMAGGLTIEAAGPQEPLAQNHSRAGDVTTASVMPADTTFRVLVFGKDATVTTGTPIAESTYKITNDAGAVALAAVKDNGEADATGTAPGTIYLQRGEYDFYYFSPALPVTSGKVTGLTSGVDYMAVKQLTNVEPNGADSKFHINQVQFGRLCSRLDIRVTPKSDNSFIESIVLNTGGAKITGLATGAEYTLGEADIANITGDGSVSLGTTDFKATTAGTGVNAKLTTEGQANIIVLPVAGRDLTVTLDLLIDGMSVPVSVTLTGTTLAAGYKYLLDLKVDRQGSPTFTVTVAPWTEGGSGEAPTIPAGTIGTYRDGGVVFWVDPEDARHYKVVSVDETNASWSDAITWATDYAGDWRLPTQGELNTLYNARQANGGEMDLSNSVIDKAITALEATSFGSDAYWSATDTDNSNAQTVKLTDGNSTPAAKTVITPVRLVREMPVLTDYLMQPANCYITQPGRTFRFDATKKPRTFNGSTGRNLSGVAVDAALANTLLFSDIKDVKIVWQTAINHSTPADGKKADMILQSVSYDKSGICTVVPHATGCGNALIAAYATDGTTILWNWHIWVTEGEVQGNVQTGNTSLNGGGNFMDRNLGALAATTTQPETDNAYKYFGLLYQHGRPTPFTGQGIGTTRDTYTCIYDEDGIQITTSANTGGYDISGTAVSNVTTAIQKPKTFYSQSLSDSYSWFNQNYSLWSDYGANKSIYDPCPFGYRVPVRTSWSGFTSTNQGGAYLNNGSTWNSTWWPIAGYRYSTGGGLYDVGNNADYWSSTFASSYKAYNLYFSRTGNVSYNNIHCGFGFPVRCVEDK